MEYNAIIREYSGKSLKVLGNVLLGDFDDVPQHWTIRYNAEDIDRSKISLGDLCCNPLNPIQLYKPPSSGFDLTVTTLDGEEFKVYLGESDNVSILKLKIFQLFPSYPPQVQTLRLGTVLQGARKLDDTFPILHLNVSSGYGLYIKPCFKKLAMLNSGLTLHNISGVNLMEAVSASPSPWKKRGLTFVGVCENPSCKTKTLGWQRDGNQEVSVSPKSYGNFKINFVQGTSFECSACSGDAQTVLIMNINNDNLDSTNNLYQITLTKLIMKSARTVIYCKHADSGKVSKVTRECTRGGATYTPVQGGFKKLSHLEINCVEPWRSPFCCVKCDTKILYKIHEQILACGHAYHFWCFPLTLTRTPCKVCSSKSIYVNGKLTEVLSGM